MKRLFAFAFIATAIAFTSCKEAVSNDANNRKMEDTLFKTYPNLSRVSIDVQENEHVHITLGDEEFYNAAEDKRKQVTDQVARITVHIYEDNNWLKDGSLTFVPSTAGVEVDDAQKKTYEMNIKPLLNQPKQ